MGVADALPEYDVLERHAVRVDAPPERAVAAALAVTAAETPVLRRLFRLRGLPADGERPLWEAMQAFGFTPLDATTLGACGRPWRPRGSLAAWKADGEPGWALMAIDFHAADGLLATETRVRMTSPGARRAFRAYWLVVRPFSGVVRRSWLHAARRRAETAATDGTVGR